MFLPQQGIILMLRASQNYKVETIHEIILKPDLSRFCVCFCIEESTPLLSPVPILRGPCTHAQITVLRKIL
jgi:hypothetical protein